MAKIFYTNGENTSQILNEFNPFNSNSNGIYITNNYICDNDGDILNSNPVLNAYPNAALDNAKFGKTIATANQPYNAFVYNDMASRTYFQKRFDHMMGFTPYSFDGSSENNSFLVGTNSLWVKHTDSSLALTVTTVSSSIYDFTYDDIVCYYNRNHGELKIEATNIYCQVSSYYQWPAGVGADITVTGLPEWTAPYLQTLSAAYNDKTIDIGTAGIDIGCGLWGGGFRPFFTGANYNSITIRVYNQNSSNAWNSTTSSSAASKGLSKLYIYVRLPVTDFKGSYNVWA